MTVTLRDRRGLGVSNTQGAENGWIKRLIRGRLTDQVVAREVFWVQCLQGPSEGEINHCMFTRKSLFISHCMFTRKSVY